MEFFENYFDAFECSVASANLKKIANRHQNEGNIHNSHTHANHRIHDVIATHQFDRKINQCNVQNRRAGMQKSQSMLNNLRTQID